jgi:hypothetical protein
MGLEQRVKVLLDGLGSVLEDTSQRLSWSFEPPWSFVVKGKGAGFAGEIVLNVALCLTAIHVIRGIHFPSRRRCIAFICTHSGR